ncbi:MAG: hypothetical protein KatS3mg115_0002 [Candidatus Poribacteria bacterium]|nr:MAG: hypothetical protein KatS3mg115_0002 [Candidatus Poribacteria bacterium]
MKRREISSSFRLFWVYSIGFFLIVSNAYWLTVTSELMEPQNLLTFVSLFFSALFSLFFVIVLDRLWKAITPFNGLSPQETLGLYIMTVMTGTVGGHTLMTFLIGTISHPYWFATPENEWANLFWAYIPKGFTPDPQVLKGYFYGRSTLYTWEHLRGWLVPVLFWTFFIALIWWLFSV